MKKSIVIVGACGANFTSLQAAFLRLGYKSRVSNHMEDICQSSHLVLPGVGAANHAMKTLKDFGLNTVLSALTQPVLGICLGMQLLCRSSEEGDADCLGIIPLKVKMLSGARIYPHMGWNQIAAMQADDPLLSGISPSDDVYFVHGYAPEINSYYTKATCSYGETFSAYINYKNFYGVQFHPEKSGDVGERLLKNFLDL